MRSRRLIKGTLIVLVLAAFALTVSACGSHRSTFTSLAGADSAQPREIALDDALAQLDALAVPEGVKPEVFQQLKDALAKALRAKGTSKFTSTPPTGDANKVTDLAIAGGGSSFTLSWSYRNSGDYDQSGAVGISDITPIAMHYGQTYEPADENCIQAVVDGSCNCVVDIADITTIAMRYATDCEGYRIQVGNSPEGTFTSFRNVSRDTAAGGGRLSLSVGLTSIAYLYVRVVPYDASLVDGEPSEPILVPGTTPDIASVTPLTGIEGESVTFSAEVSGTPPYTCAWDFGGGTDPDTSAQSNPTVTMSAVGQYDAQLTVSSVFGQDVFPFTLTVSPTPPAILSVSPTEGTETFSVQFSAEVTGSEPFTYAWDFGGGASPDTSDEAAPTITLAGDGEYSAELTVSNAAGDNSFPFILTVNAGVPPDITSVSPLSGQPGSNVTFTAVVSGAQPLDYTWDFKGAVTGANTSAPSPSGVWGSEGTYADCSLTVTNAFGNDTYLFTLIVESGEWHLFTVDGAGDVGETNSLYVVNGNPAISYTDWSNHDLKYARAIDVNGTSWDTPITVDSAGDVGGWTSLYVVNGNPAISYCDWSNSDLKYARATDANGTSWITSTVDSTGDVGWNSSLFVVNSNPAISYRDSSNLDIKYARATDVDGTSWITYTVDGAGSVGEANSLYIVNGNPAISYHDSTNDALKYARATDANGTSWITCTVDSAGEVGACTSLAVVNGNPAISYFDFTNKDLKYVRATDANGTAWGTPVIVDSAGNVGWDTSLFVVDGNPAISYRDYTNSDLKYARATDANGTSWITYTVDSVGDVGWHTSLFVVNGNPAISYVDSSNADLKFAIYY